MSPPRRCRLERCTGVVFKFVTLTTVNIPASTVLPISGEQWTAMWGHWPRRVNWGGNGRAQVRTPSVLTWDPCRRLQAVDVEQILGPQTAHLGTLNAFYAHAR